jgi:hypothetical protein
VFAYNALKQKENQAMAHSSTIFSQLLQLVSKHDFKRIEDQGFKTRRKARSLTRWGHYEKHGWRTKTTAQTAIPLNSMPDALMEAQASTEPPLPLECLPDRLEELKTELPLFSLPDESTETETLPMPERELTALS